MLLLLWHFTILVLMNNTLNKIDRNKKIRLLFKLFWRWVYKHTPDKSLRNFCPFNKFTITNCIKLRIKSNILKIHETICGVVSTHGESKLKFTYHNKACNWEQWNLMKATTNIAAGLT